MPLSTTKKTPNPRNGISNGRRRAACFSWTGGAIAVLAVGLAPALAHPCRHGRCSTVVNAGRVRKAVREPKLEGVPTNSALLRKPVSVRILRRREIQAVGPAAGAAQALSLAPGVNVSGYGTNGASKFSISINGIKQGWAGASGGNVDDGSIAVMFDGVPMNDPATGLWQSPEVNQLGMIQGIAVTYGPGGPVHRWYDNIGGSIDFIPLQPAPVPSAEAELTAGSFGTRGFFVSAQSGRVDGVEAVVAGGALHADSYRDSIGGFSNPAHDYAWYAKIRRNWNGGSLSFGAYTAFGQAFRPNVIPVSPIPGVTVNGVTAQGNPIPGPLYSETTTGFYSALPYSVWHKNDSNRTYLFYSKLKTVLSSRSVFHMLAWYRYGSRLHVHYYNFQQDQKNLYEYNDPHDYTYGDRMYVRSVLPFGNVLDIGGYWFTTKYVSQNSFYNPAFGGSVDAPNAKYRSDDWYLNNVAAFIQDSIHLPAHVRLTPGLRFVHYGTDYFVNGPAVFPNATGTDQGKLPNSSTTFSKLEPSVFLTWQAARELSLFANYSVAYRQPSNGGGGGPYQHILASSLQLEEGREIQVGAKYLARRTLLGKLFLGGNYYTLRFSHQIIPVTSANGNYLTTASGSSRYQGFTLYGDDEPLHGLGLFFNLAYEKADFTQYSAKGTNYNGLPVSYVPNVTANIGGDYRWHLRNAVSLTPRLWLSYTGPQHIFNNNTGAPSTETMPSYTLVNAALAVDLPHPRAMSKLTISVDALNLLGRRYNNFEYISSGGYFVVPASVGAVLAYPAPGRSAYVTIAAAF